MTATHFYQLCEAQAFSDSFELMDFIQENIDMKTIYNASSSPGFQAMTKLSCYLKQSKIIVSNINLDYISLTPLCVDCEGNLAGIL